MDIQLNVFYQHQDGGLYLTKSVVTSSVDLSQWVVYDHVWPFEIKQWIRPLIEWTPSRFKQLSYDEATSLALGDKEVAQKTITEKRDRRRSLC